MKYAYAKSVLTKKPAKIEKKNVEKISSDQGREKPLV
jgi:hypothetical protein